MEGGSGKRVSQVGRGNQMGGMINRKSLTIDKARSSNYYLIQD